MIDQNIKYKDTLVDLYLLVNLLNAFYDNINGVNKCCSNINLVIYVTQFFGSIMY